MNRNRREQQNGEAPSLTLPSGYPLPVNQGSLIRILSYIRNGTPFLMMSAFDHRFSYEDNMGYSALLLLEFRSRGLRAFQLNCSYTYPDGKALKERYMFVPGASDKYDRRPVSFTGKEIFALGKTLGEEFEQESFVYGDGMNVWLFDLRYHTDKNLATCANLNLNFLEREIGWSKWPDRYKAVEPGRAVQPAQFAFEAVIVPSNWINALGLHHNGIRWF